MPKRKNKKEKVEPQAGGVPPLEERHEKVAEQEEPVEIVETKPDATLEDMILHIYAEAPLGPITVSRLLGETGLASQYDSKTGTQILSIAWGKLALKGKVSKTQFIKE